MTLALAVLFFLSAAYFVGTAFTREEFSFGNPSRMFFARLWMAWILFILGCVVLR